MTKKYRIKQHKGKFYPQYKNLFWNYYDGQPYEAYGSTSFITLEKEIFYYTLYFDTFEKANNFLNEQKEFDKIVYYKIN